MPQFNLESEWAKLSKEKKDKMNEGCGIIDNLMNKGASYGKKHTVPAVPDCDLPLEADRDIKVITSVMSITDRIGIAGLMNLLKGEHNEKKKHKKP